MDFEISHDFPADADRIASVLLDEGFQASLNDLAALADREVLAQEQGNDGMVVRRTRCVLDIELTGMVRSIVGNSEPAWVEHATWHPEARRWDWFIEPEVAGDLLSADGTIEIAGDGKAARRIVTGRVKVKVPLYGGKVEGWIVEGLERAYEEEAERLSAWLEREKP